MNITPQNITQIYSREQFKEDFVPFLNRLETVLKEADKEVGLKYPRAYTGNIYWFMVVLANVYYLDRVVEYLGVERTKKPVTVKFDDVALDNLRFNKQYQGWGNKVQILDSIGLDMGNVVYKGHGVPLWRKAAQMVVRSLNDIRYNREKDNIFLVQGGYEISKKDFQKYNFVSPIPVLEKIDGYQNIDIPWLIVEFLDQEFKYDNTFSMVLDMFSRYHSNVVQHLSMVLIHLKVQFTKYKPKALLYSIGAVTVLDDMLAWYANENNIPVFYFQHGGGLAFGIEPFEKYIEKNPNIKKTMIYRATKEATEFHGKALGTNLILNAKNPERRKRKVLYIVGPPVCFMYKDFFLNTSDAANFTRQESIVKEVEKQGVDLDIKVHPLEKEYVANWFKDIKRSKQTRIISRGKVENILHKYDLLIIDYLTSAVPASALAQKVPVVLYINDYGLVRRFAFKDLEQRTYMVTHWSTFQDLLSEYKQGKLKTKWTQEFYDAYCSAPKQDVGQFISERI